MVTPDLLIEVVGGVLLGLVGFFAARELEKIDSNLKELRARLRELSNVLHEIDNRLSVAETRIEEGPY